MQLPPIKLAKNLGYHIITTDFLPANPGHLLADESFNISTTDFDSVLRLAKDKKIDAIIDYGSDPSAATAAYVSEKMGLCGNPFNSVKILAHKNLFREFLRTNGFNYPRYFSCVSLNEGLEQLAQFKLPAMVKPVDSSGSKGVSKIVNHNQFREAYEYAIQFSRCSRIIVEEFIHRKGYQIAGDGFIVDGRLKFRCFAQEHFDDEINPFAPIGESFPLILPESVKCEIDNAVQRVIDLLGMQRGALNFDIVIDENDRIFLMEIGPRAGGHLISEVIKRCTDVDMTHYVIKSALGEDCSDLEMSPPRRFVANYAFRTNEDGTFLNLLIPDNFRENVIEKHFFLQTGEHVSGKSHSGGILGCLILEFSSAEEMLRKMDAISRCIKVIVC